MSKRIIALILAVITVFSVSMISANATTYMMNPNGKEYCQCTLTKPGKKDAYVTVSIVSTNAATVTFRDANGRYIWSERNAIRVGGVMPQGSRQFKLGKNHSVYRIYVTIPCCGTASFSKAKNCTIR